MAKEFLRDFEIKELNVEDRKFTVSFSSEEPYERWFGTEILSHAEAAVNLTRLQEIGVVLFNHDRDKVVGKINRAWIENSRGYAEIEFDDDEESDVVFKKVAAGTLKGMSVGYKVDSWEEVAAGKKSADGHTGPCSIARSWTPFEISVVSVPADATVGIGRQLENGFDIFEKQLVVNRNLGGIYL